MNSFGLEKIKGFIEAARVFALRVNLFNFGLFVIIATAFSIYFPFPLSELFVAFSALFFCGYLFFRLIIKDAGFIETFVISVILSMGIIVFFTFILTVAFNFLFDRNTIASAAVMSNVVFLGIHFVKGAMNE